MEKFKNNDTGQIVGAFHPKEGTLYNGIRSEVGDWDVDGELVKPADFNAKYTFVSSGN